MTEQLLTYEGVLQELANAHLVENLELYIPRLSAKARQVLTQFGVTVEAPRHD